MSSIGEPSTVHRRQHALLGSTRIALGWIFLWAFLDKWLGLGFATPRESAWVRGGSPTSGFLNFANPDGPFAGFFSAISSTFVDWLFMVGLLGIGLAFMLGIGMRIGAASGALLLFLMWLALLPTETNPFLDQHILYGLTMVLLAVFHAGDYWGLGTWWRELEIVQKAPWLE